MDLFPPTLHHKKIISYTLTHDGQNGKKKIRNTFPTLLRPYLTIWFQTLQDLSMSNLK